MYTTLLMDLDNTILDFSGGEILSFKKIIESFHMTYSDELFNNYQRINHVMWQQLEQGKVTIDDVLKLRFERFFMQFDLSVNGLEVDEQFRANLSDTPLLMPYAREVLQDLKEHNITIYSASNGVYHTQMRRLKASNLLDLFDGHFISNQIGFQKPSIEFFNHCTQALKNTPLQEMLMVGDSLSSDIAGANQANIDSCYYAAAPKLENNATYTIQDLRQLLELIK